MKRNVEIAHESQTEKSGGVCPIADLLAGMSRGMLKKEERRCSP
jgi:hypothetical protein